jgi:hypothetical protein
MSYVIAAPELMTSAATDLASIGSTISAANAAAAPTTGIVVAAEDEVSAAIAAVFSAHGHGFQALSARAAAFHEQFVQALTAGARTYAAAEANAAQTLVNAVNAPAVAALGHSLIGSGAGAGAAGGSVAAAGGVVSNALGRIESVVLGNGAAGLFGSNFLGGTGLLGGNGAAAIQSAASMLLQPTGGIGALTAARALLAPAAMTNAAVAPTSAAFGDGIKFLYNAIEPWVFYGFQLAQYAVGWVPYVGWLAPQITIFYTLIEPIVQSGLFNILDWLSGSITFGHGLSNFIGVTAAEINQFIYEEIHFFLPGLPPLPPFP